MRSSRQTRAQGEGEKEAEGLPGAEAEGQQGEAAKYEEDQHPVLVARRMEPGQGAGAGDRPRRASGADPGLVDLQLAAEEQEEVAGQCAAEAGQWGGT